MSVDAGTQFDPERTKPLAQVDPHVPAVHVLVAFTTTGQARAHAPQLSGSLASVASQPLAADPSQSALPAMHVNPQVVPLQVAVAFAAPAQIVPHAPHEDGSERLASHPLARFVSQLPKPAEHASPQVRFAQVGVACAPPAHAVAQPPQWSGSVRRSTSQPLAGLLSQSAKFVAHVIEQVRAVQFAVLFGPAGQTFPHALQLFTSLPRFTHVAPHRSGVAPTHPEVHENEPEVDEHIGVAPLHITLHAPQFDGCARSVSHPFDASPPQFAKPAAHARFRSHAPALHRTEFATTCGRPAQSFAQEPQ